MPELNLPGVTLDEPFVFWNRRRGVPEELHGLTEDDKRVATDHLNRLIDSVGLALSLRSAMAVNDYSSFQATERSKILQLLVAKNVGLSVPETLISTNPSRIYNFTNSENPIIGKALGPAAWRHEGETTFLSVTAFVTSKQLPREDLLRVAPVILQLAIPKSFEVRVMVMGDMTLAARLDGHDPNGEGIDWRTDQERLEVSPYQLPLDVRHAIASLTRELGLRFGCVDMIVDTSGRHVFIEINQMGQFLWMEERCPEIFALDTFCQFLSAGRPDFILRNPRVAFADIRDEATTWLKNEAAAHSDKRCSLRTSVAA